MASSLRRRGLQPQEADRGVAYSRFRGKQGAVRGRGLQPQEAVRGVA